MLERVRVILEGQPAITSINKVVTSQNQIDFTMAVGELDYDFQLTLREDFPRSLPLVVLANSYRSYPHSLQLVGNLSWLCLGDPENLILQFSSAEEVIGYTLKQIKRLFSLSPQQIEKEYQREFLFFFDRATIDYREIRLYVRPGDMVCELERWVDEHWIVVKDRETRLTRFHAEKGTYSKAIYIPLYSNSAILPPGCGVAWDAHYIRRILNENVSYDNYQRLCKIQLKSRSVLVVFKMRLDHGFDIMFCVEIRFRAANKGCLADRLADELNDVVALKSNRFDSEYLQRRIGSQLDFLDKRVLLVGCGSLGSYIAQELPKIGIQKITIVDNDSLNSGNVARHSLGMALVGLNKAEAMKMQIDANFPEADITAVNGRFPDVVEGVTVNLKDYSLVIVATGGTDRQLAFNSFLNEQDTTPPVLYTWIEGSGIAVHTLLVEREKKGCFNCLLVDDQGSHIAKNKAHLASSGNMADISTGDGCGATFTAYGNVILLRGTALVIHLVIQLLSGKIVGDTNSLFSTFALTQTKYGQNGGTNENPSNAGRDYIAKGCTICGRGVSAIAKISNTEPEDP